VVAQKMVCEDEPFDIYEVPTREFEIYWNRRMELADTASNDLVAILEDAFDDTPEEITDEEQHARSEAGRALAKARWKK